MLQAAFDAVRTVKVELDLVQNLLDQKLADPTCIGADRQLHNEARAHSEKTYLLRLLAEFERQLTLLGPSLAAPVNFTIKDGLAVKLDRIGKQKGIDKKFRKEIDDKIREHRNELFHGRSPIPRVSFDTSLQLVNHFLRWCW